MVENHNGIEKLLSNLKYFSLYVLVNKLDAYIF